MTLGTNKALDNITNTANNFLVYTEGKVQPKIAQIYTTFETFYLKIKSGQTTQDLNPVLNINNLSSISRIHLFKKIIQKKLEFVDDDDYWKNSDEERPYRKDQYPTILEIGNKMFFVTSYYYERQPGSVKIVAQGLNFGKTWINIYNDLMKITNDLPKKLLWVTSTGDYSKLPNQERSTIAEAVLLLDYEVSRRLIKNDDYIDLPVVAFLPYLIENIKECRPFFTGQKASQSDSYMFVYNGNYQSLFTGVKRRVRVANILQKKIGFKNNEDIICRMSCLCQKDEFDPQTQDDISSILSKLETGPTNLTRARKTTKGKTTTGKTTTGKTTTGKTTTGKTTTGKTTTRKTTTGKTTTRKTTTRKTTTRKTTTRKTIKG